MLSDQSSKSSSVYLCLLRPRVTLRNSWAANVDMLMFLCCCGWVTTHLPSDGLFTFLPHLNSHGRADEPVVSSKRSEIPILDPPVTFIVYGNSPARYHIRYDETLRDSVQLQVSHSLLPIPPTPLYLPLVATVHTSPLHPCISCVKNYLRSPHCCLRA